MNILLLLTITTMIHYASKHWTWTFKRDKKHRNEYKKKIVCEHSLILTPSRENFSASRLFLRMPIFNNAQSAINIKNELSRSTFLHTLHFSQPFDSSYEKPNEKPDVASNRDYNARAKKQTLFFSSVFQSFFFLAFCLFSSFVVDLNDGLASFATAEVHDITG